MVLGRFCSVAVLAGCWLGASVSTGFSAKDSAITTSGLPVPRYVSLKSDHVNVRAGPTKDNDVAWIYTRSGPAGRNHRRIRELAPRARLRRLRGLGLSFPAVGPPHRGRHHEDQGRTCAALRSRRSGQRRGRPSAGRRRHPGQEMLRSAGAASPATALTAGSSRAAVGRLRGREGGVTCYSVVSARPR